MKIPHNRDEWLEDAKEAGRYTWAHFADDWLENVIFIGFGYLVGHLVCRFFG